MEDNTKYQIQTTEKDEQEISSEKNAEETESQPKTSAEKTEIPEEIPEQEDSLDENKEQIKPQIEMLARLGEVFEKHIEKLLETKTGIEDLPLNLFTVLPITLLAVRETEIESFPYLPPERYTKDTIINELTEGGIDLGEGLSDALKSMMAREYLKSGVDSRIFAKKPVITTAKLVDRIFPQMPGENFIAYLGQLMDEVQAERKTIDQAVLQLDQMLDIHGISIKELEAATAETGKKAAEKKHEYLRATSSPQKTSNLSPPIIQKTMQKKSLFSFLDTSVQAPANTFQIDPQLPKEISQPKTKHQIDFDIQEEVEAEKFSGQKAEQVNETKGAEKPSNHAVIESEQPEPETVKKKIVPLSEEEIEKQIATFEEKLGMMCPLCRTGEIRIQDTTRGKMFYQCENESCNFISWGKPFYITCQQCDNPFLIEATDTAGSPILKCPKATCHFWQNYPWDMGEDQQEQPQKKDAEIEIKKKPRRRVRKVRRVVRRKK